jgi:aryl-alcohol dehydrogenase-like predicted oxidoreductase
MPIFAQGDGSMLYRELGTSGVRVPMVGLGTWAIGGTWWGGADEADSIAAIRRGVELGMTLIDTAPVYGYGLSEEVVGKAMVGLDRGSIILATKVGLAWHVNEGQYFFELAGQRVFRNLKPATIRYEVEQSLRRLGTDYIDLYQTHWQDNTTPIADTMATLLALKDEGKIRAIGVSNCSPAQMDEYRAVGMLHSNQPLYNMLDRGIETELLPYCHTHNIGVLTYSSLALGLLTGTMDPNRAFGEGDQRRGNARFSPENIAKTNALLERFAPLREKYGLTQAQLAIAWTISRPGVTTALVGVRNARQAEELAPGGHVALSPDDLAAMDAILADA